MPREGDSMEAPDGSSQSWTAASAGADGTFTNSAFRGGGYLETTLTIEEPEIRLLEAAGHNLVYVNGVPRGGDPYSYGYTQVPVALKKGTNEFLFHVARGRVKASLLSVHSPAQFNLQDATLPDVVRGNGEELWGAVVVLNCTTNFLENLRIVSRAGEGQAETALPSIPPLSLRKVPFGIDRSATFPTNSMQVSLELRRGADVLDRGNVSLRVREANEQYKVTFSSQIDGSLQYYAVTPAVPGSNAPPARALFLSTHGASVEAIGQAQAYAPKTWGWLAAPTNRRPYGFDWEDWGRMDALEVLELARARFKTDPRQTYLTGHSMGGHGAWQLGVTFPDRFAAIAPSAGWISFRSYGGGRRSAASNDLERLLERAATPGDTLTLASNYLHYGVYVLHGDADDNVPVSEARKMKEVLSEFHRDFVYHEQPGAGHWWGNQCVDWPPIFDFFGRHQIPEDRSVSHVQFSTANPGISASSHWVTIMAQEKALARSSVDIHYHATARKLIGTTENTAVLALDLQKLDSNNLAGVELDGQALDIKTNSAGLWFTRKEERWKQSEPRAREAKGPQRNGPFKEAFNHRMIFVYGTTGTVEENAWSFAKARFDAELWYYRGNGAVEILADNRFKASAYPDRGVVLYGNAQNNSAWAGLLSDCPVQVAGHSIKLGEREFQGDDLACIFCWPRPDSERAMVAVVAGTGLAGLRLTERLPYFISGVAFPDCTILSAQTLKTGSGGLRAVGFFGNDWSVKTGEFAFAEGR